MHDSNEDAMTALRLYEKHQQLTRDGTLQKTLVQLYSDGRTLGWKITVKSMGAGSAIGVPSGTSGGSAAAAGAAAVVVSSGPSVAVRSHKA